MRLNWVGLSHFRCFQNQNYEFAPGVNLLFGDNGAGKTAVLEAIHVLCTGVSFLTRAVKPLVRAPATHFVVSGRFDSGDVLGVRKSMDGTSTVKLNRDKLPKASQLAKRLPVLLVDNQLTQFMDGNPQQRRHYLNWGMFHVEHDYHQQMVAYQRALQQRNALLRSAASDNTLFDYWEGQLAQHAVRLTQTQANYCRSLGTHIQQIVTEIKLPMPISLDYQPGFSQKTDPFDVSAVRAYHAAARDKDRELGYTARGVHRFDIKVSLGEHARERLSRGQKKLCGVVFRLAQSQLLTQGQLMLFDDLHAELSPQRSAELLEYATSLGHQCVVTTLLPPTGSVSAQDQHWFHVKHDSGHAHTHAMQT